MNTYYRKGEHLEMKRRLLIISLVLALALVAMTPAAALADEGRPTKIEAYGEITGITAGIVTPLGESGRWRVIEREILGTISGDINGDFNLTYKGVFKLEDQAGNFHGTMETGTYFLRVNGKVQPLEMVQIGPEIYLPKLTITGHWTFTDGAQGQGDLNGWAIFIPTSEGHVGAIIASAFALTGQLPGGRSK